MAPDARVVIADEKSSPRVPLAAKPYPIEWEKSEALPGIGALLLRPIRPRDEQLYEAFLTHVTPEDLRLRFFTARKGLSHEVVARLTQIDYAREMAFVAITQSSGEPRGDGVGIESTGELLGVARLAADPDNERAEYAVMVRSDLKGHGLGWLLMQHLVAYAKATGIAELFGSVLAENITMLKMCRELGFEVATEPGMPSERHVTLMLGEKELPPTIAALRPDRG